MTAFTKAGSIPIHQYCYVDRSFLNPDRSGFEPCVWFAITAHTGRVFGCHVMLECGAVFRSLPPHALAYSTNAPPWTPAEAQRWDCYGQHFSTIAYPTLYGLDVTARIGNDKEMDGTYLFNVVPIGDPYSEVPDQDKEFVFCKLDNGRITIQPTNRVLFRDKSFTQNTGWPDWLLPLSHTWHCE